jgi:hypothetical protein
VEEATDVTACACAVFINTGSGGNFVASTVLATLGRQPVPDKMPQIGLVNGLRVKPLGTCALKLTLGTFHKALDFIVLPVVADAFQVILGGPWCSCYSADLLHSRGVCVITDADTTHEVACADTSVYTAEDIPFVPCHLLSPLQFKRSLKQSEAVYLVMVTTEKSCDTPVADTELNSLLEQFRGVLVTELPPGLPPVRTTFHRIPLQEGAEPPAPKSYLSRLTEQIAVDQHCRLRFRVLGLGARLRVLGLRFRVKGPG